MRYLTPLNYLATFAGSILGFVMGILAYRVAYEVGGWIPIQLQGWYLGHHLFAFSIACLAFAMSLRVRAQSYDAQGRSYFLKRGPSELIGFLSTLWQSLLRVLLFSFSCLSFIYLLLDLFVYFPLYRRLYGV